MGFGSWFSGNDGSDKPASERTQGEIEESMRSMRDSEEKDEKPEREERSSRSRSTDDLSQYSRQFLPGYDEDGNRC